jgi:hypothetical protein
MLHLEKEDLMVMLEKIKLLEQQMLMDVALDEQLQREQMIETEEKE